MKVTAKDFEDNPTLTPLQIIRKLEDDKFDKCAALQRKRRAQKAKDEKNAKVQQVSK